MKLSSRWIGLCAATVWSTVGIAQKATPCQIAYANQNQIDYEGRGRMGVFGVVTDPSGIPVPGACVAVFTEKEHRFVVGVRSTANGRFDLPLLSDGNYRLVVELAGFGIANMKFRKIPEDRFDSDLHVHMRVNGIDSTSYIDPK